jgi:hypothetical protein
MNIQENIMRNLLVNKQSVAVYSVIAILRNMRNELGLEAMSEFIDLYVAAVDRINPELKDLLHEALSEQAINNFYQAVVEHEKN